MQIKNFCVSKNLSGVALYRTVTANAIKWNQSSKIWFLVWFDSLPSHKQNRVFLWELRMFYGVKFTRTNISSWNFQPIEVSVEVFSPFASHAFTFFGNLNQNFKQSMASTRDKADVRRQAIPIIFARGSHYDVGYEVVTFAFIQHRLKEFKVLISGSNICHDDSRFCFNFVDLERHLPSNL